MKKRHRKYRVDHPAGGFDHVSSSSEFYSSSPVERPLSDDKAPSDAYTVGKTGRHEARNGRGEQKMDPREKMALMSILKSIILILSLLIAFVLLWRGIKLYEESIWIEKAEDVPVSPVLQAVELVEDFNIEDQDARKQFAQRIEFWKEAERLISSADILAHRNMNDQAIKQCQEALRHDPSHLGALKRLGALYYTEGRYVEAVNAYIRLLSVDPSGGDTQKKLIQALDAYGDHPAVRYMAEWYMEENLFDIDVQRSLARAYFELEEFALAAEAYEQVVREFPHDTESMEKQVAAYMQIQRYEEALEILEPLVQFNHRNRVYYSQMAICNAQMERPQETVQNLVRATQLFGAETGLMMVQEPLLDPVRDHRSFQSFVDRIGGKEFRLKLEELARKPEDRTLQLGDEEAGDQLEPQLFMPGREEENP